MKKTTFTFPIITLSALLFSCNGSNKPAENTAAENNTSITTSSTKDIWAEEMETKSNFIKTPDYDDVYWNNSHKGLEKVKIFNTIVDAVLAGKQKAYDLGTDSLLTIDEVKAKLVNHDFESAVDATKRKTIPITVDDFSGLRFREKWTFDKENFKMEKQVYRIDLTAQKISPEGEFVGDKGLFYVKLNN